MEGGKIDAAPENEPALTPTPSDSEDVDDEDKSQSETSLKAGETTDLADEAKARDNARNGTVKKENMKMKIAVILFKRISLLLLGYLVCYINLSLILPIIAVCSLVWYENIKSEKGERIRKKIVTSTMTKDEIQDIVKDLPSWLNFPDREKAEWLNEIIAQLWPSLNCYIIKYCRGKIQTNIRKKFESFRFEELDFGNQPPKIDGVKVYSNAVSKDSVIIDFEVYYDGDCDISFSMSGTQIGRIKDFQMGVEIRVVLKPILYKVPIIGGMQIFFLNIPDIHFELEGITGIPGFSYLVRQKIEEIINKKLVFPNKISKRFSKSVEAAELKSIEAEGVLRVHVFEARDLEKKDMTGKSDPYAILNVGAQEQKTKVINRELNPQWDHYCEFIILDPVAQQLHFKLFDQDEFSEDDFLGSGAVVIADVIKPDSDDQWFELENVKHGKIHLRFSWLALSCDRNAINAAAEETRLLKIENIHTALLTIYIDSALNLPKPKSYKRPDPYMILTVGKNQTKSRTKRHTCNPVWEQGFYLLVKNPENDSLIINIMDKQSDTKLDKLVYNIATLLEKPEMQISKQEFKLQQNLNSSIIVSLQLRILHKSKFEIEELDSDSDDECSEDIINTDLTKIVKESRSSNASTPTPPSRKKSVNEKPVEKTKQTENAQEPTIRTSCFVQSPEQLGRIELSLSYSELRQKLLVIVHRISALPLKDPNHIPDPYVKLKLSGNGGSAVKHRTKVIVDSCDPIYEETFEYLLSVSDLPSYTLVVTVKNKKMFSSSILGQITIDLKRLQNSVGTIRSWYELLEEQVSD
ncbi:extended synaptotagmin-3-like [Sitophilus oryzae]|uniref:Extended synaptotagmin-3-like n=1 Tax=Sitophilus oryzae TaxID=7048 RepID=A0A6J2YRA1_SITOR|nr:extended synaptotagmin-3-like [Sitophilus oryzae]